MISITCAVASTLQISDYTHVTGLLGTSNGKTL